MKKTLSLALLLLAGCASSKLPSLAAGETSSNQLAQVGPAGARLYAAPDTTSAARATVAAGSLLTVLAKRGPRLYRVWYSRKTYYSPATSFSHLAAVPVPNP